MSLRKYIKEYQSNKDSRRRVLFVVTQSEFGGAQRFLFNLIHSLDANKFSCALVAGRPYYKSESPFFPKLLKLGIPVFSLKHARRNENIFLDILATLELRKIVQKFNPDILFLASSKAGAWGAFAVTFPTMLQPKPVVIYRIGGWTFNDPWPQWKKNLFLMLEKLVARWKDIIVTNTEIDREQGGRLGIVPRKKMIAIPNGIDANKIDFLSREDAKEEIKRLAKKITPGFHKTRYLVGTIANFYPTKGIPYLIEAINLAEKMKHGTDISYVIIGDGKERRTIQRLIERFMLRDKVALLGQLQDAFRYLKAFDLFVLPSVKEGSPWTILEAMAAKVPVIATAVGGITEIITDKKNGIVIPAANPSAIAKAMVRLLQDDAARQELAIQGHQNILHNFSIHTMIKRYEKLFLET